MADAQIFIESPSITTGAATNIGNNYVTLNSYVSTRNNVIVTVWFEWGPNSYYNNQTTRISYGSNTNTNHNYSISGLTQNTSYYFRAVAQNGSGQIVYGNQMVFTTTGSYNCASSTNCYVNQPVATTYPATGVTSNSAILNGYINPNGYYATRWFEWGTSIGYLPNSTNKVSSISYPGNFSEPLYNLSPNTTYYFRAVAQNGSGITTYGNTSALITNKTPEIYINGAYTEKAVTIAATNIGNSSARLNGFGLINNGVYNNGYFEYGTTTAFGNTTAAKNIGNMLSNPFYESLFNLESGTIYYYRAVITNQYGISRGEILSFRTGSPVTSKSAATTTDTKDAVKDGATTIQQGAVAFLFGDGFLPNTLFGWLLIGLLVFLLVLAARKAYRNSGMMVMAEGLKKK